VLARKDRLCHRLRDALSFRVGEASKIAPTQPKESSDSIEKETRGEAYALTHSLSPVVVK
jgi:hypothetical protein